MERVRHGRPLRARENGGAPIGPTKREGPAGEDPGRWRGYSAGSIPGRGGPGGGDAGRADPGEDVRARAAGPAARRFGSTTVVGGGAGGSNASEVTRSSRPCATTPHAPDQDGRCRRRYRRRWIVERTIGWLGTFCRLTVRYDRLLATYGGSTRQTRHVVCPACQTPLDGKPLSEDLLKATVMGSPDGSGGRSVESRHGADHISHATCFGVPAPPLS